MAKMAAAVVEPSGGEASLVDRWGEKISEVLPSLLVKEVRQMLRRRFFIFTFLAGLPVFLMIAVGPLVASSNQHIPSAIVWVILGLWMVVISPALSLNDLSSEKRFGTWELIQVTSLEPRSVIYAKWMSRMLVVMMFVVCLLPMFMAYNAIPGRDIVAELFTLGAMVMVCGVLTAVGLFISSAGPHYLRIIFGILFGFLGLTFWFLIIEGLFSSNTVMEEVRLQILEEEPLLLLVYLLFGLLVVIQFLDAARLNLVDRSRADVPVTQYLLPVALLLVGLFGDVFFDAVIPLTELATFLWFLVLMVELPLMQDLHESRSHRGDEAVPKKGSGSWVHWFRPKFLGESGYLAGVLYFIVVNFVFHIFRFLESQSVVFAFSSGIGMTLVLATALLTPAVVFVLLRNSARSLSWISVALFYQLLLCFVGVALVLFDPYQMTPMLRGLFAVFPALGIRSTQLGEVFLSDGLYFYSLKSDASLTADYWLEWSFFGFPEYGLSTALIVIFGIFVLYLNRVLPRVRREEVLRA